jgi:hypothetical protein
MFRIAFHLTVNMVSPYLKILNDVIIYSPCSNIYDIRYVNGSFPFHLNWRGSLFFPKKREICNQTKCDMQPVDISHDL